MRWRRPSRSSGGGGADEDLEGVGGAALGARLGDGALGGLEDGALVLPHQEADGGGLALSVADPEVGGVDGDHAAVGAADAVAALPAGEAEGLGEAGADAGGVGPGGEVAEGFAGDLLGAVAEEFLGVLVPGGDRAAAVDLGDGDADAGLGDREEGVGEDGAGGAGADGALGEVQVEPDVLAGGGVVDAPAVGECRAEEQAAAVLAVRAAEGAAGLDGDLALGVPVGDLDADAVVGAEAEDLGGGAGVDDGVGDELAGEDDGVVDEFGVSPALEGVPDEGAGGRDGPPDGLEAGSRPRGDHSTPRTRLDARLCHARSVPPAAR